MTAWIRGLLEKLLGTGLVNIFSAFYGSGSSVADRKIHMILILSFLLS
jgi:hypothetical protein